MIDDPLSDHRGTSPADASTRTSLLPAATVLALLLSTGAFGQAPSAVERNLPPVGGTVQGRLLVGPESVLASEDDTALGVTLKGIVLIGPREKPAERAEPGLRIGDIGEITRSEVEDALRPFIGRPLSRKRLAEMQAAVAGVYRDAGRALVSVTVPPQEVTGGVLTLRVVEFRIGTIRTKGVEPELQGVIAAHLRASTGDRIAVDALDEDIAWLNRNPFRTVTGVLTPGAAVGTTDLSLEVTPLKPWKVFAGYSNTGTRATGFDRVFAGFAAALPGLPESHVSYQVTGSADLWSAPASIGGAGRPHYHSQAGRIVFSAGPRRSIELVPSYVATRQTSSASFSYTSTVIEVPLVYRIAVSELLPDVRAGELQAGVSFKNMSRTSRFGGDLVGAADASMLAVSLGWSASRPDPRGSTGLDVKITGNPGGVIAGNGDARWSSYTSGRVSEASFVHGRIDLNRLTHLPAGWSWVSQVSALAAGGPLPDTEQMGLGGLNAARGYALDDGTGDAGIVWRNELRAPSFSALDPMLPAGAKDRLSPYAFFDAAWGRTFGWTGADGRVPRTNSGLAGVGLGLDYTVDRNITTALVGGVALRGAGHSNAGDLNLQIRVSVSY